MKALFILIYAMTALCDLLIIGVVVNMARKEEGKNIMYGIIGVVIMIINLFCVYQALSGTL